MPSDVTTVQNRADEDVFATVAEELRTWRSFPAGNSERSRRPNDAQRDAANPTAGDGSASRGLAVIEPPHQT